MREWPITLRLALLIAFAFAVRLVVVLCVFRDLPGSEQHEAFGWEQGWIARSMVLGHGFGSPFQPLSGQPTALVAPLYPLLLAGIFRVFGLYTATAAFVALALNALISASTVLPVYRIACKAVGTPVVKRTRGLTRAMVQRQQAQNARWVATIPWAAAVMWALYPFSIYFSSAYLWDCTLTASLFAWTFYGALTLRGATAVRWAWWGLLYGATALCNPSILSLFPMLVLVGVLGRGMPVRRGVGRAAVATGMLLLALLPWTVRNMRALHAPVPLRDGYWLEFWAGNSGDTSVSNPSWAHPASNPAELQKYLQMGEIAYMAEKQALGLQYVAAHPVEFVKVTQRRVLRFWTGFWSFSAAYRAREPFDVPNVPFCTGLTLLTVVGLWDLLRRHRRVALAFLAVIAVFPFPYYLTHSSMDYRQPIEPEIAVLVVIGAARTVRAWRERRSLAGTQMVKVPTGS